MWHSSHPEPLAAPITTEKLALSRTATGQLCLWATSTCRGEECAQKQMYGDLRKERKNESVVYLESKSFYNDLALQLKFQKQCQIISLLLLDIPERGIFPQSYIHFKLAKVKEEWHGAVQWKESVSRPSITHNLPLARQGKESAKETRPFPVSINILDLLNEANPQRNSTNYPRHFRTKDLSCASRDKPSVRSKEEGAWFERDTTLLLKTC